MNFIKPIAEFDLISFGEVMLRLSPPDKEKISQSEVFEKTAAARNLMLHQVRQTLVYALLL